MPQHYLGIDVGTTAVKALVVDESGAVAGEAESPLEVSVPRPGWAEQDPADWWQATVEAVRAACAAAGVRRCRGRRAVGPDAQLGTAGRRGQGAEAGDTVERRPHDRPVPLHNRDARQDRPAQARGQSRRSRASPRPSSCGSGTRSPACSTVPARSCCPRTTCACS